MPSCITQVQVADLVFPTQAADEVWDDWLAFACCANLVEQLALVAVQQLPLPETPSAA